MHECATHSVRTDNLGDAVRLRTRDGYVIAIGDTLVTDHVNIWRDESADRVTVRRLPKDHIMRIVGTGVYVASKTAMTLVFSKTA